MILPRLLALGLILLPLLALAEEGRVAEKEPQEKIQPLSKSAQAGLWLWERVQLGTLWYIHYVYGDEEGERFNRFTISRGYLTARFKPIDWFAARITMDTHQDDTGDWKVRLKYLHGKFSLPIKTQVVSEPFLELGMVHTPWFDYEEHINPFRAQGTMFIERNGLLNSADLGVTAGLLFGERLDERYIKEVSGAYPGRYGSLALGVYNGGGYHAEEANDNKTFQMRLTVRPVGFVLPHLQVSYLLIFGKGNTPEEPDWVNHDLMLAFEHPYFAMTGQYTIGEGNQRGSEIDDLGRALDFQGFSFFGALRLPWIMSVLFARYDWFDWGRDGGPEPLARYIVGYAFYFYEKNALMLDFDLADREGRDEAEEWAVKLTLQVSYP